MSRLVGPAATVFAANITTMALNAVGGILAARLLGPEGRGALFEVLLWPQIAAMAVLVGLPVALTYHVARWPCRRTAFLVGAIQMVVVNGAAAAAVLLAATDTGVAGPIRPWAMAAAATVPFFMMSHLGAGYFQGIGGFRLLALTRVAQPVFVVSGLVLLRLGIGEAEAGPVAAVYLTSVILTALLILGMMRPTIRALRRRLGRARRRLVRFGAGYWGYDLLDIVARNADKLAALLLLSQRELGIYVVAASGALTLSALTNAIASALLPRIVGAQPLDRAAQCGVAARCTVLLGGGAVLAISPFSSSLIGLVYGPAFAAAALPFSILLVEVVVNGTAMVIAQAFLATGRPQVVATMQAAGTGVGILALVTLTPVFGLTGIALAQLAGAFIRLGYALQQFEPRLGVQAPSLLPQPADLRFVLNRSR